MGVASRDAPARDRTGWDGTMPQNDQTTRAGHGRRPRLASLLLTMTALAGAGCVGMEAGRHGLVASASAQAIKPTGPSERLPDFSGLVKQVKPAVVSITSIIRNGDEDGEENGGEGGGQQQ